MSTSNHHNQQGTVDPAGGDRTLLTNPVKQANTNWLNRLQQHSKLLMALVEPNHFTLQYANESFCRITGITALNFNVQNQGIHLWELFLDVDKTLQEKLYRRHLLTVVLRDLYHIEQTCWRVLDEPMMACLKSSSNAEPRCIQFWLRSEHLKVERIDPQIDEFADLGLSELPVEQIIPQESWEERLQLDNYRVKGQLLWEGLDVTHQEIIRRLINLLIERD
ncbi:MAG TPA: histidine kinase, partial [Cyanobacteria bacterium UBA11148]|nr:histidine kinase [Cyanobacteria bacterium UBA11148]